MVLPPLLQCAAADATSAAEHLVRGLDADVSALRQRGRGKIHVEGQVRPVRLIHDERDAVIMRDGCNGGHVAAYAKIGWTHLPPQRVTCQHTQCHVAQREACELHAKARDKLPI